MEHSALSLVSYFNESKISESENISNNKKANQKKHIEMGDFSHDHSHEVADNHSRCHEHASGDLGVVEGGQYKARTQPSRVS